METPVGDSFWFVFLFWGCWHFRVIFFGNSECPNVMGLACAFFCALKCACCLPVSVQACVRVLSLANRVIGRQKKPFNQCKNAHGHKHLHHPVSFEPMCTIYLFETCEDLLLLSSFSPHALFAPDNILFNTSLQLKLYCNCAACARAVT